MDPSIRIREASRRDLSAIAEAERICFSDPWSETGLRELFQHETMLGLVAETSLLGIKQVAGYLFARAIREEAEILNLAVLPEFRRQGLGRQLLAVGLERLNTTGIAMVYLEVRESNLAARALYSLEGFSAVGVRADYYRRPREHALVLRRRLSSVRE